MRRRRRSGGDGGGAQRLRRWRTCQTKRRRQPARAQHAKKRRAAAPTSRAAPPAGEGAGTRHFLESMRYRSGAAQQRPLAAPQVVLRRLNRIGDRWDRRRCLWRPRRSSQPSPCQASDSPSSTLRPWPPNFPPLLLRAIPPNSSCAQAVRQRAWVLQAKKCSRRCPEGSEGAASTSTPCTRQTLPFLGPGSSHRTLPSPTTSNPVRPQQRQAGNAASHTSTGAFEQNDGPLKARFDVAHHTAPHTAPHTAHHTARRAPRRASA
jgi:hypothetical protein